MKILKVNPEKVEIINKFIECLINFHDGVGKETELYSFHKRCESVRKAYRLDDEDYDTEDGIMDKLREAKNKLFLLLRKLVQASSLKKSEKSCSK